MTFDNFTFRLLRENDLNPYYRLVQDNRERLRKYFAGTVLRTENMEATKEFLAEMDRGIESKTYFPYVLIDNTSHKFIGFFDLKNIEWRVPKSEIGFFIDLGFEGKGIGTKALKVFHAHCFSTYGFEKLFLRTHESNQAARKMAESCGFVLEGRLRSDYRSSDDELVDVMYYGLLPSIHTVK